MSELTVAEVIAAWSPGQKIPTPKFDNWRDIRDFAQWLADNEHIPGDLRAKAAEHVVKADHELAWWSALADASRAADPDYPWDDE